VRGGLAARLREAGLSDAEAARKAELFARARASLGHPDAAVPPEHDIEQFWVPGRIEFLGKHTDYAGGRSLLCTVERGICLIVRPRQGSRVRVIDAATGETVDLSYGAPSGADAPGHWSAYPASVVRRVARNFGGPDQPPLLGGDIAFLSDLPPAAGLSSSSAIVVAVFLALATINELSSRPEYLATIRTEDDLAGYAGSIESGLDFHALRGDRGVGTLSGSEDQTAMFRSRPGMLVQYAFCPVRFERAITLPDGYTFVIAASGVVAQKTADALPRYNALALKARAVADAWRASRGGSATTMGEVLATCPEAATEMAVVLAAHRHDVFTPSELHDRFEQFYHESTVLIPAVGDLLAHSDLASLGVLIERSVTIGAQLLGNQVSETLALTRLARTLGAVAASPFGAGWGGSVWSLVAEESADGFLEAWRTSYLSEFPERTERAEFFRTRAGPAAMRL
jgi:galactokinase